MSTNDTTRSGVYVPNVNERERIPQEAIDDVVRQIADLFHPERIILFGSYAYGTPRPDSDVDLLVVMDTPLSEIQQEIAIWKVIKKNFALDLLVRTSANFMRRISMGDFFLKEIVENGKVLYGSAISDSDGLVDWQPNEVSGINPLTSEWIERAEGNYITATILAQAMGSRGYDQVCYHSQECVEQYLKAYLQEHQTYFPKLHNLLELLELCLIIDAEFKVLRPALQQFTQDAETYGYPGYNANEAEANMLSQSATTVRIFIRAKLGL